MPLTPAQHEYNIIKLKLVTYAYKSVHIQTFFEIQTEFAFTTSAIQATIKKVISTARRSIKSVATQSSLKNLMLLTKILTRRKCHKII